MQPPDSIELLIPVQAVPGANNKRAFVNPKTGKAHVVDKTKGKDSFIATVKLFASEQAKFVGWKIAAGAHSAYYEFRFARPNSHYGTGKNEGFVKPKFVDAPHGQKPDVTNLVKRLEDALTDVVWADDRSVDLSVATKTWHHRNEIRVIVVRSENRSNFVSDALSAFGRRIYQADCQEWRGGDARGLAGDPGTIVDPNFVVLGDGA